MTDPNTPAPFARPRQLTMAFDSTRLRRMSATDRQTAVTMLAALLIEAAMQNAGGGDDER